MARRRSKKTERDELSESCKLLTKLLMSEASGGIIPLPKGAENYKAPPIPFAERRALLDSASKGLLIDMKVNPESEPSGFELLKEELDDRTRKRNSTKNADRGAPAAGTGADPDDDSDSDDDFFLGTPN